MPCLDFMAYWMLIGACDPTSCPNPRFLFFLGGGLFFRLQDRALVADAAQFLEQMDYADSAGARQGGKGAANVRAPTADPADESCPDESYPDESCTAPGPGAFAAVISAVARQQPQKVGYALRLLERMTAVHGWVPQLALRPAHLQ